MTRCVGRGRAAGTPRKAAEILDQAAELASRRRTSAEEAYAQALAEAEEIRSEEIRSKIVDNVMLSGFGRLPSLPSAHEDSRIFGGPSTDHLGEMAGAVSELNGSRSAARGRRARRADNPRKKRVNLSYNSTEYELLRMAAGREGLTVGAYVAHAALAVAKGDVLPLPVNERERLRELAQTRVALNRIGTNLNQIAHVLNAEGKVTPEQLAAVLSRVEAAVERLDAASIELLGRA